MTDEEFNEKCLTEQTIVREAGVKVVKSDRDRDALFKGAIANSDYFFKGVETISKSNAPYLVFILGFFAMEHRANALALISDNYKLESHICAQIYLSRIVGRKDLAQLLSKAWNLRIGYNYRMDLSVGGDVKDVENFIGKILKPFIVEIDKLIKDKKQS